MPARAVWSLFEEQLFQTPSTNELFNPYRDRHPGLDRPDGPATRRANLKRYVDAYTAPPKLLLLMEAPGPWGCRFSGIPVTSEAQLVDPTFPIDGAPTSLEEEPHNEYSANIFWRVLQPHFPHFFVWNSVPFHPHDEGAPLTIRTPRRSEVTAYGELLTGLVEALQPDKLVAIGRKAEQAYKKLDLTSTYVRHPSHGGAKKFERGVRALLAETGVAVEG